MKTHHLMSNAALCCLSSFTASTLGQTTCPGLAAVDFESGEAPAKIISSTMVTVPSSGLALVGTQIIYPFAVSQYCRVTGYVAPQNHFEIRLPDPGAWNGKMHFVACQGFCGTVNGDFDNAGLSQGYAAVTANGGHFSAPGFDGLWAANSPQLQKDFGYTGNHVVTVAAKKIVAAYYGSAPRRSYMGGCSKGGQAVLEEALRYPDEYDGILPFAPVYDYTGKGVIHASWVAQANRAAADANVIDDATVDLIHDSVLASCDALDGAVDGVVGDPLACRWTPSDLACSPGRPNACLTPAQVRSLTQLYAPPINRLGQLLFPTGNTLGSENAEWKAWVNNHLPARSFNYTVAQQSMAFLEFARWPQDILSSDPYNFDFNRDPDKLQRGRNLYDATSVDLRAFAAHGGKVLWQHGWADASIPAKSSVHYYLRTVERFGLPYTNSFVKLYLLPGVTHCGGGAGSDHSDALAALDNWVERGQAPDRILTYQLSNGTLVRPRPVWPYPGVARFSGTGSADDPDAWTVTQPGFGSLYPPAHVVTYENPIPNPHGRSGDDKDDR